MATATPTANSPLTACWTLSRRTSRRTNTRAAAPTAAQMPVRRPFSALATMKATVGRVASSMPRQPPSCSSTRWRSKEKPGASGGAVVSDPPLWSALPASSTVLTRASPGLPDPGALRPGLCTIGGGSAGAELVPGVVNDPFALDGGEPPAGGHAAPGLDPRDPPPSQPDQRHRAAAV